jgi:hypothetical protein
LSEDLKRIVTSVYRSGKGTTLSMVEFVSILSYTLRFFAPDKARKVHQAAMGSGLLLPDGQGMFAPSFPLESVTVEPDYRPPADLNVDSLNRSLSDRLIDAVCRKGMDKKDAIKTINRTSESLGLLFAASAIHVGIEGGLDMSVFYGEVESSLLAPSG